MTLRPYEPDDAAATLEVFRAAVHATAAADYSPVERAAWAPDDIDIDSWGAKRAAVQTVVAVRDDAVVGFSDLLPTDDPRCGHIDMLFVHPLVLGTGVARALLDRVFALARDAGYTALTVEASITARPVFERRGFELVAAQRVERDGVRLTNFRMRAGLE